MILIRKESIILWKDNLEATEIHVVSELNVPKLLSMYNQLIYHALKYCEMFLLLAASFYYKFQ
jgi:hypothetical protein